MEEYLDHDIKIKDREMKPKSVEEENEELLAKL